MHILVWTVAGLVLMAAFVFAPIAAPGRATRAHFFIALWFVAALVNSALGFFQAGIPLINEVGAFLVVFGVPAVLAAYLARRAAPANF